MQRQLLVQRINPVNPAALIVPAAAGQPRHLGLERQQPGLNRLPDSPIAHQQHAPVGQAGALAVVPGSRGRAPDKVRDPPLAGDHHAHRKFRRRRLMHARRVGEKAPRGQNRRDAVVPDQLALHQPDVHSVQRRQRPRPAHVWGHHYVELLCRRRAGQVPQEEFDAGGRLECLHQVLAGQTHPKFR